jgi:hypothetical protein
MPLADVVQNFVHKMHALHQKQRMAAVVEKRRREAVENELEIKLMEISALMGLYPSHPMVIAAVAYVYQTDNERRQQTERVSRSFIGQGWPD